MSDEPVGFCPVCSRALVRVDRDFGLLWACDPCQAAYATLPVLKRLLGDAAAAELRSPPEGDLPAVALTCPFCGQPQIQVMCSLGDATFLVPWCRVCRAVRLEREILEAVQVPVADPVSDAVRQVEALQRVALVSLIRGLEKA